MAQEPPQGRKRTVGDAIGGFARRVGELLGEVSAQVVLPDGLKEGLERARLLRLSGAPDQALGVLRALPDAVSNHAMARFSAGLCHVHDGLRGGKPLKALLEIIDAIGDEELGPAPQQLLRAAHAAFEGRHEAALDDLRRATRDAARVVEGDGGEARFLAHVLAAGSHFALGHEDRTLRELQKARAHLPPEAGAHLRAMVLVRGVEHLLAADLLDDAELWVREALTLDERDREATSLLARVLASKGDRDGAEAALLGFDEDDPAYDRTRLFIALCTGGVDPRPIALRVLQRDPEDPALRRLWALAELRHAADDPAVELEPTIAREIIASLVRACEGAAKAAADRYLHELAHAALRLELFPDAVRSLVETRLRSDAGTAPEELRLIRARVRLAAGDASDAAGDFVAGVPPRFRGDAELGGAYGPDPQSPVRNDDTRTALRAAERSLAVAELCLARNEALAAQELLVQALVEWPALPRARALLGELVHPEHAARLEDLLTASTSLLAGVPTRVLGVSLEGVQTAMSMVIAARERLARPLTIAIMGEFSAGKSTFVNALLGEAVAPMGVLPTTTTINVFRSGPSGGGRVHYRDGHIETLAADEVQPFLHGLDSTAAAAIRHVEIERTGLRMGDTAVVDTPGLNALDPFHEQVARSFIDEADAVVWLFSATRSGAASEVGMLASLRAGGRQVLGVLNKVDTLEADEQRELADYLRAQLGEVLVEVVPVRAREALEHRTGDRKGEDPFAAVEQSLERNFMQRARELKRELTTRRLREALALARGSVSDAIEALTQRGVGAHGGMGDGVGAAVLLRRFADALGVGVLDVDDALVREGLSLGVLRTGKGVAKPPLDPQDAGYLGACFRDATLAALRRALLALAQQDSAASEVVDRELSSWAQGQLEGLVIAGFVTRTMLERGGAIVDGEAAARAAFRDALSPIAAAWSARAEGLVHALERARARARRWGRAAPQAEALRLRATVLSSIDALAHAAHEVQA